MLDLDARKLTDQLVRMAGVCDSLPQIAQQVAAEAQAYVQVQADLSIYRTVASAGGYVRTGTLRDNLRVTARATRNTATVTVDSRAPYAGFVELGREGMTYAALQALAQAQGGQPYTLGRTGLNWTTAAPITTAGQAFGAFRIRQVFAERIAAVR